MKFLNSHPVFKEFLTANYQFYIKGKTNIDYSSILDTLRDGKFPNNLKGNFAFYFSDKNRTVIAVDHLPNYQMFYSEDFCGHIFINVQNEICKYKFEN
jgi:asparagine synthetase B (glutamine-hydrolysing)